MRLKPSTRSAENETNKRRPNPVPGYTGEREQQGLCVYYKQDFFVPTCCCYLARGPPSVPSMLRAPMFTLDTGSCESDASSEDWCWRGCRRLLAEAICRTCLSYRSGVSGMTDNCNRRGPSTIPSQSKADSVLFDCCLFFFTPLLTCKVNARLCLRNTAWKLFGLPLMTHQTLATPLPGCLCDVGGKASGGPEAWKADSERRVKTGCFRRIPAKFQGQGRETKGKTGARLQFAHGTDTGWMERWGCWDCDLNHGVAITRVGLFRVFFSPICFLCEMLADGELRLRNPLLPLGQFPCSNCIDTFRVGSFY